MITKYDLQLICNYSELNTNGLPVIKISYMDFIYDEDEEKRQIISERREKVIDAIIDNKVDEFEKFSSENQIDNEMYIPSISPRMMSKNISSNIFTNYDDLWKEVIKKLESLTLTPSPHQPIYSSGMDADVLCRKIITKCLLLSNLIASKGRTGPGTTVISGYNAISHLIPFDHHFTQSVNITESIISLKKIAGMDVVIDPNISPNKVIIMRTEKKIETGLTLVKSLTSDHYFLSELGKWENKIQWFDVI
jgi:hypothetical protein